MRAFQIAGLLLAVTCAFAAPCRAESGMAEPYTIHVSDETLRDLKARLRQTRWPDQIAGSGWDYGTDTQYLKELVAYWAKDFDWRAQEKKLNAFHQYRAEIDGVRIHFIHERGKGPHPIPILLLHGWPSSFVQFQKIIPLLTDPAAHGAPDAPSFDVVVASLPGFGFSDIPRERGFAIQAMAERMTKLMTETLGYQRFALRGSDIGGSIIQQLSLSHPDKVIGAHISGLLRGVTYQGDKPPSEAELKFNRDLQKWTSTELAYATLHSSKPQTQAVGLNDSPAGLASWIVEKFQRWGDTKGNVESRFSKDELLTNLTIYWATQTIGSSMRLYYEFSRETRLTGRVTVPTAALIAQHDMVPPPREVAERLYNIVRFNESDAGGHFLEWEEPEVVAADMRAFFGSL
ncbi:MAG: epoxide hydrolase family protein [Gammaproteobacteria bacterium]